MRQITLIDILEQLSTNIDIDDKINKLYLSILVYNVLEDINFYIEATEIYIIIEKYFWKSYLKLWQLYSIFLRKNSYNKEHWGFLLEEIKWLKENLENFEKLKNNVIPEYKGYSHYELIIIYNADLATNIISQIIWYWLVENEFKQIKQFIEKILT